MWTAIAAFIATGALGYLGALTILNGRRRQGEPPLVRGTIPFLGVALAFGRDAMQLLERARARHGDTFTLFVGGRRMTFVTDPMSLPAILKAKPLLFEPVASEVVEKAFGVPAMREQRGMEPLMDAQKMLKGKHLPELTERMKGQLVRRLEDLDAEGTTLELYRFTTDLMFGAAIDALFGDGHDDPDVSEAFAEFDRQFPLMVAGLPAFMVADGTKGREYLAEVLGRPSEHPSPWIQRRLAILDEAGHEPRVRGRMQTTVLWAAQANTIPAAFWSLAHLLHHPEALAAIREELASAECSTWTSAELDRLRMVDSAIRESLRLSSGSLTAREVTTDFQLDAPCGRWDLRAGDRVCIAPFLFHRDPEIFEQPERYIYDRFYAESGVKQFYKRGQRVPLPLMPFGAGISMCPGRYFAINEIKLLVVLVLSRFELELVDPEAALPGFDLSRVGLGIYPPDHDVRVRIRPVRRNDETGSEDVLAARSQ